MPNTVAAQRGFGSFPAPVVGGWRLLVHHIERQTLGAALLAPLQALADPVATQKGAVQRAR